jgi:hypothetical protein
MHHAREPLTMEGGTTFHVVTDGIHVALKHANDVANGKDIDSAGELPPFASPHRQAHRRAAPRDRPRASGQRREPLRRHRYGQPRLPMHAACFIGARHPHGSDEVGGDYARHSGQQDVAPDPQLVCFPVSLARVRHFHRLTLCATSFIASARQQDRARASRSSRSRALRVSDAARSNSARASANRPIFFSRSARTVGSR